MTCSVYFQLSVPGAGLCCLYLGNMWEAQMWEMRNCWSLWKPEKRSFPHSSGTPAELQPTYVVLCLGLQNTSCGESKESPKWLNLSAGSSCLSPLGVWKQTALQQWQFWEQLSKIRFCFYRLAPGTHCSSGEGWGCFSLLLGNSPGAGIPFTTAL